MKNKFQILLLMVLMPMCAFPQKMAEDYFDEALTLTENKEYKSARDSFQVVIDKFPGDELCPRAYYNIGYISTEMKDYKKAKEVFQTILKSSFNEKEPLGGDIMADPYTNYKHRASEFLAEIYFDEKDYRKALNYVSLADTVYPYLHFCGNEMADEQNRKAVMYAKCYEGIGLIDSAIYCLIPYVFDNGLADNYEVIENAKRLLLKRYDQKTIQEELKKSINGIHVIKHENSANKDNEEEKNKDYGINLFGREIILTDLYFYAFYHDSPTMDTYKDKIRKSTFYKELVR